MEGNPSKARGGRPIRLSDDVIGMKKEKASIEDRASP
jgi:hypothetical protein